jgi:hypothetical protein
MLFRPANMMLSSSDEFIVTIDFGSTVDFGESIPATTHGYSLDLPSTGHTAFDLVCLSTSILKLIGDLGDIKSRYELIAKYKGSVTFAHNAAVILCENSHDIDRAIRSCSELIERFALKVLTEAFPI